MISEQNEELLPEEWFETNSKTKGIIGHELIVQLWKYGHNSFIFDLVEASQGSSKGLSKL